MLRMQVMELPNGGFVLVISGDVIDEQDHEALRTLKDATGATALWVSETLVEVHR
jgi:hypothetical protein